MKGNQDEVITRGHVIAQRIVALFNPTYRRQDVAAVPGRRAGCLEYVHGLLSGDVAWRLRLCSSHDQMVGRAASNYIAFDPAALCCIHLSHRSFRKGDSIVGRTGSACMVVVGPVAGDGRLAVLYAFERRAALAAVVFDHQSSRGQRPIFPVQREQSG